MLDDRSGDGEDCKIIIQMSQAELPADMTVWNKNGGDGYGLPCTLLDKEYLFLLWEKCITSGACALYVCIIRYRVFFYYEKNI